MKSPLSTPKFDSKTKDLLNQESGDFITAAGNKLMINQLLLEVFEGAEIKPKFEFVSALTLSKSNREDS